jgi:hypothetical protein
MLRALAACPVVTPVVMGDARVQAVSIDDLTETVARSLGPASAAKVTWTVAHPQVLRLANIVVALRQWMGFAPRRVVELPRAVGAAVAAVADLVGWFGWRSPARSTARLQLAAGVVGDPAAWMAATGIVPASLTEIFAARPATVADRWFSKLYLLKPIAIVALTAALIVLGAVRFESWQAAMVAAAGRPGLWKWIPFVQGVFDIGAGVLLPVRSTARAALIAIIVWCVVVSIFWLVTLGWFAAAYALMQGTPLTLTAVFLLAILDER